LEPAALPATRLGDWAPRLRTSPFMPPLTMAEGAKYLISGEPPDPAIIPNRLREDVRVLGGALVASLFAGLLDLGVETLTACPVRDLVVAGDAVVGVVAEYEGAELAIGARRGVVLACGGFEWNAQMMRAFVGRELAPLS